MKKPLMITCKQIKQLHTLAGKVLPSDDIYRDWLFCNFEVKSCKLLTMSEAEIAISLLENINNEVQAAGMISPKQIRYIKSLWIDIDISQCENGDKHLKGFLRNKFGVERLEDLTRRQASGCIKAVLNMKQRQASCSVAVNEDTVSVQTKETNYVFNINTNKYHA